MDSDEKQISNIQKGGLLAEQAFLQLDKALRPMMYSELKKGFDTLSYAEHEEIIQETFIKVFTELRDNKFQGKASLKNWIMTILKHNAIDIIRKYNKSPQKIQTSNEEVLNNLEDNRVTIEKNDDDYIRQAINAYHKEDAEAVSDLLLVSSQGVNAKQLAEIQGITHGASRERLSRYRKKLMGYIMKYCREHK